MQCILIRSDNSLLSFRLFVLLFFCCLVVLLFFCFALCFLFLSFLQLFEFAVFRCCLRFKLHLFTACHLSLTHIINILLSLFRRFYRNSALCNINHQPPYTRQIFQHSHNAFDQTFHFNLFINEIIISNIRYLIFTYFYRQPSFSSPSFPFR